MATYYHNEFADEYSEQTGGPPATDRLVAALDADACERIGLVAHTLYHRSGRARGGFIALHEPLDPAQIRVLVRNAAKSPPEEQAADASSDFTDREAAP